MGRHLQREYSGIEFQANHSGCMWNIHHFLDNHHWNQWHSVKKMLTHKNHGGGRHARGIGSPKTSLYADDTSEAQGLLDDEEDNVYVQVEQHKAKNGSTHKSSSKVQSHHKSSTDDKLMKENQKGWPFSIPAKSQLQQIEAVHNLDPSNDFPDTSGDWRNPIILLHDTSDTSATRLQDLCQLKTEKELIMCNKNCNVCVTLKAAGFMKDDQLIDSMKIKGEISHHQLREYGDVLEIFKVKNNLVQKIKQDQDVGVTKHFLGQQTSNSKARLTKSGSFPLADFSRVRFGRPTTPKHKQNEVWSFPKEEKVLTGTQELKFVATKSPKDSRTKVMPLEADDSLGCSLKQKTSFAYLGLINQGWNQLVITRFKRIKQRIKYALKDSKKENGSTSADVVFQRVDGKDTSAEVESTMNDNVIEPNRCTTDVSDYDFSKGIANSMSRTTSLNESADKYAQLFDNCFSRETSEYKSRSLRLKDEDNLPSTGRPLKSFRRNLSLPDVESICSILSEVSHDALRSGMPIRTVLDHTKNTESDNCKDSKSESAPLHTEKCGTLNAGVRTEVQENMVGGSVTIVSTEYLAGKATTDEVIATTDDNRKELIEHTMGQSCLHQEHGIGHQSDLAKLISVSAVETCFPDNSIKILEFPISKDICSKDENANKRDVFPSQHSDSNEDDDADFNYVRDVLELSGFNANGYLRTWHSSDQPLNPSLFKKLEASLPSKPEHWIEELDINFHHWLLFDLVNEALLGILDRSSTYFPRTLSSVFRTHPMPMGEHLLNKVWTEISWYLSLKPELDQSLDYEVALDFAKGDHWMNLQHENECVALELEELIFDELLGEVCSSLDC